MDPKEHEAALAAAVAAAKAEAAAELESTRAKLAEEQLAREEAASKLESLQDSLDSALEEMALKGGSDDNSFSSMYNNNSDPEPETPAKAPVEAKKPAAKADADEDDGGFAAELQRSLAEEQAFRNEILMREEMRDLRDELREALAKYPNANQDEVLRAVEDGVYEDANDQVFRIAKESEERNVSSRETLRKQLEEEITAKLRKEQEGNLHVPQSDRSDPAPRREPADNSPRSEDAMWAAALAAAKADGGAEM